MPIAGHLPWFLSCTPTVIPSSRSISAFAGVKPNSIFHVFLSSDFLHLTSPFTCTVFRDFLVSATFHSDPSLTTGSLNNKYLKKNPHQDTQTLQYSLTCSDDLHSLPGFDPRLPASSSVL